MFLLLETLPEPKRGSTFLMLQRAHWVLEIVCSKSFLGSRDYWFLEFFEELLVYYNIYKKFLGAVCF